MAEAGWGLRPVHPDRPLLARDRGGVNGTAEGPAALPEGGPVSFVMAAMAAMAAKPPPGGYGATLKRADEGGPTGHQKWP